MTVVPPVAEIPVTSPVEDPIVATDGVPLSHDPPPGSVNVVVAPGQMAAVPAIAPGNGFTVIVCVTWQPPAVVKVIKAVAGLVLPVTTALSIPDEEPIVATVGVLLVHVPLIGGSLSVVLAPWHKTKVPEIGPGFG